MWIKIEFFQTFIFEQSKIKVLGFHLQITNFERKVVLMVETEARNFFVKYVSQKSALKLADQFCFVYQQFDRNF